jgi:hypothetical protein
MRVRRQGGPEGVGRVARCAGAGSVGAPDPRPAVRRRFEAVARAGRVRRRNRRRQAVAKRAWPGPRARPHRPGPSLRRSCSRLRSRRTPTRRPGRRLRRRPRDDPTRPAADQPAGSGPRPACVRARARDRRSATSAPVPTRPGDGLRRRARPRRPTRSTAASPEEGMRRVVARTMLSSGGSVVRRSGNRRSIGHDPGVRAPETNRCGFWSLPSSEGQAASVPGAGADVPAPCMRDGREPPPIVLVPGSRSREATGSRPPVADAGSPFTDVGSSRGTHV